MLRFLAYILGVVGVLGVALLVAAGMLPGYWIIVVGVFILSFVAFLIWQVDGKTPID